MGLVADTHVGEVLPRLPSGLVEAFAGCDLILHAGDITDLAVLDDLRAVAPVVAVQGDHDREAGIDLPRQTVVEVAGRRIGLVHGDRAGPLQRLAMIQTVLSGRLRLAGFHRDMARRFRDVDCIVHGHLHLPLRAWVDGVLIVSPGAVHVAERDPGYERGLRGRVYLGVRRALGENVTRPSVAILEVRADGFGLRRIGVR